MEEFVFAGNRLRWQYLRAVVAMAAAGLGVWLAACCWMLLKSPALPDLGLATTVVSHPSHAGMPLARGAEPRAASKLQ